MQVFAFSNEDWTRVKEVSIELTNAAPIADSCLNDSLFMELKAVFDELRAKYGQHPVLLETEADFCDDELESLELYNRALALADAHQLPKDTIQSSLHACFVRQRRA